MEHQKYFEGLSFSKAIRRWKQDNNIIICRGKYEEGRLVVYGLNTLGNTEKFLLEKNNG